MTRLPASLERNPALDSWIRIDPERTVTFFTGKVELGQGLRTALARIGADELDISFERARVETADTADGLDEGATTSSLSLEQSGSAIRQAAAEARAHLLNLASSVLGAPAPDLQVDDGSISVAGGGATTTYWSLLGGKRFGVHATGSIRSKPPAERRIVGKPGSRMDLLGLVTGTTRYVQDLAFPGMLHGRVVRPPSRWAQALSVYESSTRGLPGVVDVVRDGSFLGVVAEREEEALAAAAELARGVRWEEQPRLPPIDDLAGWLREQQGQSFPVVDGVAIAGVVPDIVEQPDAVRTLRCTYTRPLTMHASIGPSAAVAVWEQGRLTVWSHSQAVYALQDALATVLSVPARSVRVVHTPGPGCYGHNGADDAALDAALLARALPGQAVRVVWTREQEHGWEPYGSAAVVELQASLDANGRLLDWNHDVWGTTHISRPDRALPGTSGLIAAWHLRKPIPPSPPRPVLGYHAGIHRNADPLYAVPRRRIVKHFVESAALRTSSLRSLGAFANVFAIESFVDELAEAVDRDPLTFRLSYLEDERARDVLQAAADAIGWEDRSNEFGRGTGIAFARYKNSQCYAAVAVEAVVDDTSAEIELIRAAIAADAGEVIDPDGLANQLEGGFVQAASWTLKERVAFDQTRITSLDWLSYPLLSFAEIPEIETVILDRPELPILGAGEATQGATAGAIANAVHAAVGLRIRELPLTPDRVRSAAAAA